MKIFEIKNLNYEYTKGNIVLNDISLDIKKGEQIAILGSNGSGKSTLLKIMNGLLFPTTGKISAFGTELNEILLDDDKNEFTRYFREKVGLVFQHSDVQLFCLNVNDEIAFLDKSKMIHIQTGEYNAFRITQKVDIGRIFTEDDVNNKIPIVAFKLKQKYVRDNSAETIKNITDDRNNAVCSDASLKTLLKYQYISKRKLIYYTIVDLTDQDDLYITPNVCPTVLVPTQGGKPKPQTKYFKTSKKHTDKSGITRVVYEKNNKFYIKKKSPETNKFTMRIINPIIT